jgi:hypothetical protein
MYYILLVQDGRTMPDCFCRVKFWIHDGPLKLFKLNIDGKIIEAGEGTVLNGKFHDEGD